MLQTLSYFAGQTATIYLETTNSDGYYCDGYYSAVDGYAIDGYESPVIHRVFTPALSLNSLFPQPMTKLDTGIYYYSFSLPTGAASIGSYFVDIHYRDALGILKVNPYLILVQAPFGLYSANSF